MSAPQTPYQILGEQGIRDLVDTFYNIMDTLPEARDVRKMHADDLSQVKERLGDYLTGWMGGPPLYAKKYGSVCMTEPHAPYAIGPDERDQWLLCMHKALEQVGASDELKEMLREPLFRIADAVKNRDQPSRHKDNPDVIAIG